MNTRTIFLLASLAAGCVDQDVDDNLSEDTSDLTLSGDGGIVMLPDYNLHVSKLIFKDLEGTYIKPVISGTTYTIPAIKPTVHIWVELRKGFSIPVSVGQTAFTDSYLQLQDPVSPWSAAPSNQIWADPVTPYSYLDISRPSNGDKTWTLKGWVIAGGVQYNISPITIVMKRQSAFVLMSKTFDEERCITCHSVTDGYKWKTLHQNWLSMNAYDPATVNVEDHAFCTSCHKEDIVAEWKAPAAYKNIDWTVQTTAAQRCARVAANLTTVDAINHHFHEDPRLLWSYYDPNSACMYQAFKPLGPPIQDPAGFLAKVDFWRDNYHDCANLDLPRVSAY